MTTYDDILANREKSLGVPISIGTGMAIDSILSLGEFTEREDPQPPISHYRALWINLRTLFRNAFNAFDKDSKEQLSEGALLEVMVEDIHVIISSLQEKVDRHFNLVFYLCEFNDFEKQFPNAKYKELSTVKQKSEQQMEDKTLLLFMENCPKDIDVRTYKTKIDDGMDARTLLLTHYPVDLLWHRKFSSLTLLESHTGKMKQKPQWYTKLTGSKNLTRIPFNRLTIQLFGDGNVLFASMSKSLKDEIVKLAEENRWTTVTTDEKVRNDLNKVYDPRVKLFYLNLLRR